MTLPKRIRTPWSRHWRRLRLQLIPLLVFAGAGAGTVWLWGRHVGLPHVVGQVEALRFDMALRSDGLLVPCGNGALEPFDVVRAGDVMARLDDRPVLAGLQTLDAELTQIGELLDATEVRVRQEQVDRRHEFMDQARRLAVDRERLRLDIMDRRAAIETDGIRLRRLNAEYRAVDKAHGRGAETDFRLVTMGLERDEIKRRITANQEALDEAQQQVAAATERIDAQPETPPNYLDEQLAPIRATIAAQEARIRELEIQAESLELRSPVHGTISAVFFRPGQVVTAGQPVLTIASGTGRHIVAYIRDHQRLDLRVGMAVEVRTTEAPAEPVRTRIDRVGTQVELVPPHQRRDPTRPEWGLPIRIALPQDRVLTAGELVDIRFMGSG